MWNETNPPCDCLWWTGEMIPFFLLGIDWRGKVQVASLHTLFSSSVSTSPCLTQTRERAKGGEINFHQCVQHWNLSPQENSFIDQIYSPSMIGRWCRSLISSLCIKTLQNMTGITRALTWMLSDYVEIRERFDWASRHFGGLIPSYIS